jgi:predicted lipoprotein with Yx(FWY)xxD motif
MTSGQQARQLWRLFGRLAGAGLVAATGAIHLDLYVTGYRTIPTIGWLFLLQIIAAFGLAALILVTGNRLVSAAGAGFALSTLGGYVLSIWFGLFGFREVRTTAGVVAGVVEVAAFAVLGFLAVVPPVGAGAGSAPPTRSYAGVPGVSARLLEAAVGGASLVALVLFVVAVATGNGPHTVATAGRPELKARQIGKTDVLTNAQGFTLYWFAPDTPSASRCYGTCAVYWPPVIGTPTAGPGVTGQLGTVRRTGGPLQATYNRRPLYTYIGDSAPGQANGNRVNLNGGLWYEVVASNGNG